ncbi:MAG: 4-hydroxy-3-methylbut-2-enyl diphosphate reductase, partial [uncultured Thermomicrobiales bacterium]
GDGDGSTRRDGPGRGHQADRRRRRARVLLGRPAGARYRPAGGRRWRPDRPDRRRHPQPAGGRAAARQGRRGGRHGRRGGGPGLQAGGDHRPRDGAAPGAAGVGGRAGAGRHDLPPGDQGPAAGPEAGPPGLLPGRLRRLLPPRGAERYRLGGNLQGTGGEEGRRPALERPPRRRWPRRGDAAAQGGGGQPDDQERRRADEVRPGVAGDGAAGGRGVSPLQHHLRADQRAADRAEAVGRARPRRPDPGDRRQEEQQHRPPGRGRQPDGRRLPPHRAAGGDRAGVAGGSRHRRRYRRRLDPGRRHPVGGRCPRRPRLRPAGGRHPSGRPRLRAFLL